MRIIEALPNHDLGIIFNFHHAHYTLETYSEHIPKLLSYLWCINLNGMKAEGPKIITIGQGDLEKDMILELINLGYKGPFGILGHVKCGDSERILQDNLNGLQNIFH
ncbi:hypothetical protein OAE03_02040 [Winogradskyella sp.]|nr:hypothetical protein [Winogradskyella sp.]MDB9755609.1 hypothetical protein [Winogradskyella sp.]MDC0009321.1 hypothetical protein [Winogradskyella sp.]